MKNIVFAAVAASLVLSPPASAGGSLYNRNNPMEETRGTDGWRFGTPEYERTEFQVRMVYYQSRGDLEGAYNGLRDRYGVDVSGLSRTFSFAIMRRDGVCEIHVVHPSRQWRPEFPGHELMHCSFGRWHN